MQPTQLQLCGERPLLWKAHNACWDTAQLLLKATQNEHCYQNAQLMYLFLLLKSLAPFSSDAEAPCLNA
jgi:hypothetical protein